MTTFCIGSAILFVLFSCTVVVTACILSSRISQREEMGWQ